jgi:AcrR family transcriptional regulator
MIDAAERIISEEGVEAVTARRIASDVGVAVGTPYNVFDNLRALVAEVNGRTLARLAEAIGSVPADKRPAHDVLMDFADHYMEFVMANRRLWLAVFESEMPGETETVPNQAVIDALFASMERTIRRHDARIDETSARQSARGLWGAMHGLLLLSAAGRLRPMRLDSVRPTIEHLVTCHLAGLEAMVGGGKRG